MNKVILFSIIFWLAQSIVLSQDQIITDLFFGSSQVFESQRNSLGIYRDSKVFNGEDFHPASVANIGIGLIELCIADTMGWKTNAEDEVIVTLESILGKNPRFNPDRNASGYYRHFIDMETGARMWDSEYSTIDTGILTAGALFAKRYFSWNLQIGGLVDSLWSSIDWSKSIADVETGAIFREMESDGGGVSNSLTLPFNEYMLVAYLAKNQEQDSLGEANRLWNRHYAHPQNLPKISYEGIPLLTDNTSNYLSSFVIQFAYYLCHAFSDNEDFIEYFGNSRRADSLWWANENLGPNYYWGLGAGSCASGFGYCVSKIRDNPEKIFSPHIIGGFLPIYPKGSSDLTTLFNDGNSVYALPNSVKTEILWRKSLTNPDWVANEVQGIDYSTMLFGLASLPEHLGSSFFNTYNNFFGDPTFTVSSNENLRPEVEITSFLVNGTIQIKLESGFLGLITVQLVNLQGKTLIQQHKIKIHSVLKERLSVPPFSKGIYYLKVELGTERAIQKILLY